MKKFNQSKDSEEKKVGKKSETYEQSKLDSFEQSSDEKKSENKLDEEIELRFRENRSFDLHIGRELYRFEGRESKILSKSILDHPDWTDQIKKYFSVREF